jgi:endonuclease YncB( thermonuclease family)
MPRLFLSALLILLFSAVHAADLSGRVVGISDGDTFTLLTADKEQIKIRLAEIDAPESGQPYGNKSKQVLSGLIFGKDGCSCRCPDNGPLRAHRGQAIRG